MIITIDGYSSQGKTYIGSKLAKELQMEFLATGSIVRYTAYLYTIYNNHSDEHSIWQKAIREMQTTSMQDLLACPYLKDAKTEEALLSAASDPDVFAQVVEKIILYAKGRNIFLDGRFTFDIFPDAYRSYYFCSTKQRRAALYAREHGITMEEAFRYITFRDSFEKNYTIPNHVKVIRLDNFLNADAVLSYLLKDILGE